MLNRIHHRSALLVGVVLLLNVSAVSAQGLPEPFTLKDAFSIGDGQHPSERAYQAALSAAEAEHAQVDSRDGFQANLNGKLRWVDPNDKAGNQEHYDAYATLSLSKQLYDFGRSDALEAASDAALEVARIRQNGNRNQRAMDILKSYLGVVEADLNASAATENMTMRFLNADKAREWQEMERESDLNVAALEAKFQAVRIDFVAAESLQRTSRARLTSTLNLPEESPETVLAPEFPGNQRELPELSVLFENAAQNNSELKALQAEVLKERKSMSAAERGNSPVISAELEANHWERDLGGRDYWRGGLNIKVPLFSGGSVDAAVAKSAAKLVAAEAKLDNQRLALRQQVLETYEEIALGKAKVLRATAELEYRELDLDRARGEYQLEFKADLGDSMVRFSQARLIHAKAHHALALAWAKMDMLTGEPVADRVLGIGLPPVAVKPAEAGQ